MKRCTLFVVCCNVTLTLSDKFDEFDRRFDGSKDGNEDGSEELIVGDFKGFDFDAFDFNWVDGFGELICNGSDELMFVSMFDDEDEEEDEDEEIEELDCMFEILVGGDLVCNESVGIFVCDELVVDRDELACGGDELTCGGDELACGGIIDGWIVRHTVVLFTTTEFGRERRG